VIGCVIALWTGGAIGESMETLELARFFFDIGYSTFMDTMFSSIVSGIMIERQVKQLLHMWYVESRSTRILTKI